MSHPNTVFRNLRKKIDIYLDEVRTFWIFIAAHHLMDIFRENQHAQAQLDDGLNVAKKNNQKIVKKVGQQNLFFAKSVQLLK